jgi:hypothetical protein
VDQREVRGRPREEPRGCVGDIQREGGGEGLRLGVRDSEGEGIEAGVCDGG